MKDAAATWALIIGIDSYDNFKGLTSAARDAAEAVAWLRGLGVPDAQILLHAAPCDEAKTELDALGLTYHGCTEPEIWASFMTLMDNHGSKLYVFLSGHGFFEPGGYRVFLTREASDKVAKNLGIDWYAKFLRGQDYTTQYLVMDGCLNLPYSSEVRSRFVAGAQSSVALPPEREVFQVFCFAASMGERALEDNGHGLFMHTLLQALDPQNPSPLCVDVDHTSGALLLDLDRAVRDVVAPTVTERAAQLGRRQRPGLQVLSPGPAPARMTIVEIPATSTARVSVWIDPVHALADVQKITLFSDDNSWRRVAPTPPAATVQVPVESTLPTGLAFAARCTVRPGSSWSQPPQQEFITAQDREVRFSLDPRPAGLAPYSRIQATVNTVGPDGQVVGAMSPDAYQQVEDILADTGADIGLARHETGPVLWTTVARGGELRATTLRVARMLNSYFPDIWTVIRNVDIQGLTTSISIPLTAAAARRLGGLQIDQPVVSVGDIALSLRRLVDDSEVTVEPGPVTVRVTLPWGTWVQRVTVDPLQSLTIRLPRDIGVPPMRTKLLGAGPAASDGPGRTVAAMGPLAPVTLRSAHGVVVGQLTTLPDDPNSAWRVPLRSAQAGLSLPRWQAYGEVPRGTAQWLFPLSETGPLAVQTGRSPRAEPLSTIPSPYWDRLVSSGRLDEIAPEEAVELTREKWVGPLLGLAGAYACFAQRSDEYLRIVLENLRGLEPDLPDLPILQAALDRRAQTRTSVADELNMLGHSGAVPVFRWGVALGILAAEHYNVPILAAQLRLVDRHLAPNSAWTMWRAPRLVVADAPVADPSQVS